MTLFYEHVYIYIYKLELVAKRTGMEEICIKINDKIMRESRDRERKKERQ